MDVRGRVCLSVILAMELGFTAPQHHRHHHYRTNDTTNVLAGESTKVRRQLVELSVSPEHRRWLAKTLRQTQQEPDAQQAEELSH
uniref:Uncharacterized protein n=1 Tax=Anopheles minimus TaxID=112268 RepID=A0A182VUC6_9DIPT